MTHHCNTAYPVAAAHYMSYSHIPYCYWVVNYQHTIDWLINSLGGIYTITSAALLLTRSPAALLTQVCPSVCLLHCILHPCCLSTENPHLKSTTLHDHPLFLPLILHINLLFYLSRRLLCIIFASTLPFVHVILHVKMSFSWQICTSTHPFRLQYPTLTCCFTFQDGHHV